MSANIFKAICPQFLTSTICPVVIAFFMAFGDGIHNYKSAFQCLIVFILLHIGANLSASVNCKNAIDANQQTEIKPIQKILIIAIFISAVFVAFPLIIKGGLLFALIFILTVFLAIFYSYCQSSNIRLTDFLILLFLGPIITCSTYFLQSLEINIAVILSGIGTGLLSVALLGINKLQSVNDVNCFNKNDHIGFFGKNFIQYTIVFSILSAILLPLVIYAVILDHIHIMIASFSILLAGPVFKNFSSNEEKEITKAFKITNILLITYTLLFSIGWNWVVIGYYLRHFERLINV